MKTWTNAEIVELDVKATAQTPTTELSADDFQNGYFKQGTSEGSGAAVPIPYYPSQK